MKAKAISEFKVAKPNKGGADAMDTGKAVEYEPYDFPDGEIIVATQTPCLTGPLT